MYSGKYRNLTKRAFSLLLAVCMLVMLACGCNSGTKVKLDPKNPVTISVWHYYNGPIMNAFEEMIKEFNETVGAKEGIIVEGYGLGSVPELEKAVIASANKAVGSLDMPNIFASYADTAYTAEKMGLLANLDDYFTKEEQKGYIDSYIEEGKIGLNGELRIFPIAKSTEIFMLNETDWQPFADANKLTHDDLRTMEGVARVSEMYYNWTASKGVGKSFFGRDVMANLFIIASKEFGTEIFSVENGKATINVNADVMRKIWDYYYIPYISGYYSDYGKFRSDDAKVGDILCYVGSSASASYFPSEVTVEGKVYPIEATLLPAPLFEGGQGVMVQQGAGMVVTKSTPQEEYASVAFLKWFTQTHENVRYAALSGYMSVKKEAVDYDTFIKNLEQSGQTLGEITSETLRISLEQIKTSELYTNKAFDGGTAARAVLEYNLHDKAAADREEVLRLIENGASHQEAVARFKTDENFNGWITEFTTKLNEVAK